MRKRALVLGIIGILAIAACGSPDKTTEQAQAVDNSQIAEDEQAAADSNEAAENKETTDSNPETINTEEINAEETNAEETNAEETNAEETNADESGAEDASNANDADQATTSEGSSDSESSDKVSRSVTTDQGDVEPLIAKALEDTGVDVYDIKDSVIADFDGDGTREAFVFIGGDIDEEWSTCQGQLYYVTDNGKEMIKNSDFVVNDGKIIETFPMTDKTFVAVDEAYTTSSVSFLYYVENGECKDSYISGIGGFYKPDFVDDYAISLSCYDMSFDYEEGKEDEGMYMGHTWKPYYFYYDDATGRFEEYIGKEITEDELNAACGFDLAAEIRAEGNQIDGILKRDNGIINVNYSQKTEYEGGSVSIQYGNATFNEKTKEFVNAWGDGENTWQNSNFGGTYLTAISIQ